MKLHLGSGSRYLDGYLHVDIADYQHIDIKSSVDKLNTIDNDTVDEIYASHVLEYFDRNEVESVLNEWKRVLKKDGVLRIAVPNFEALIKVYQETAEIEKILGPLQNILGAIAAPLNIIGEAINKVLDLLGIQCNGPKKDCAKTTQVCSDDGTWSIDDSR